MNNTAKLYFYLHFNELLHFKLSNGACDMNQAQKLISMDQAEQLCNSGSDQAEHLRSIVQAE